MKLKEISHSFGKSVNSRKIRISQVPVVLSQVLSAVLSLSQVLSGVLVLSQVLSGVLVLSQVLSGVLVLSQILVLLLVLLQVLWSYIWNFFFYISLIHLRPLSDPFTVRVTGGNGFPSKGRKY